MNICISCLNNVLTRSFFPDVKLYENTDFDINFFVVNELSSDQEIDVKIEDTRKFAQTPIFVSATLTPGQNYTGRFVIKGGMVGETTYVYTDVIMFRISE